MLIYNSQKKLVGIDEADLRALGFSTLADLTSQVEDFADLFVKKPGYIHNFQHVNWIDFAACIDIPENAKVIIHTGSKDFQCTLKIGSIFLMEAPTEQAFTITLNNLYELKNGESIPVTVEEVKSSFTNAIKENMAQNAYEEPVKPQPQPMSQVAPTIPTAPIIPNIEEGLDLDFKDEESSLEDELKIEETAPQGLSDEIQIEFEDEVVTPSPTTDTNDTNDLIDIEFDDAPDDTPTETLKPIETFTEPKSEPVVEEKPTVVTEMELYDNGYIYDPQVAASELGLPVDLIEEFIGDFIAQAREFEEEIYSAYEYNDDTTLHLLSHKLKGVAANLRIEDALESVTIINTSDDRAKLKENIEEFYKIISKLAGEKIKVTKEVMATTKAAPEPEIAQNTPLEVKEVETPQESQTDELTLDFKDDVTEVKEPEEEVPSAKPDEDLLELDFKDDNAIQEEIPIQADSPKAVDDTIELDFKDDNDDLPLNSNNTIEMDEDELTLDFKDDNAPSLELNVEEERSEPTLELRENEAPSLELPEIEANSNEPLNFDKQAVASEIGIDQDTFDELFDDYIFEAKAISNEVGKALSASDLKLAKDHLLRLKIMSENMRIQNFDQEIEKLLKTEDISEAQSINGNIKNIVTAISAIKE